MALVVIGIGMATIDFLQDNQCSPNNGSVDLFDRKLGNMVHVIVQRNSFAQKIVFVVNFRVGGNYTRKIKKFNCSRGKEVHCKGNISIPATAE